MTRLRYLWDKYVAPRIPQQGFPILQFEELNRFADLLNLTRGEWEPNREFRARIQKALRWD